MNSDNALQLVDLLQDIHMIEEAHTICEEFLKDLSIEDVNIDRVRAKIKELSKIDI